jgi:hypothetical protein
VGVEEIQPKSIAPKNLKIKIDIKGNARQDGDGLKMVFMWNEGKIVSLIKRL